MMNFDYFYYPRDLLTYLCEWVQHSCTSICSPRDGKWSGTVDGCNKKGSGIPESSVPKILFSAKKPGITTIISANHCVGNFMNKYAIRECILILERGKGSFYTRYQLNFLEWG